MKGDWEGVNSFADLHDGEVGTSKELQLASERCGVGCPASPRPCRIRDETEGKRGREAGRESERGKPSIIGLSFLPLDI